MYNQNVQLWRLARTAELSVIELGWADDWQDHPDCPHRVVFGQDRVVQCRDGDEVTVSTSCIQFSDGSIDIGGLIETPAVQNSISWPFSSDAARQLAAAIIESRH